MNTSAREKKRISVKAADEFTALLHALCVLLRESVLPPLQRALEPARGQLRDDGDQREDEKEPGAHRYQRGGAADDLDGEVYRPPDGVEVVALKYFNVPLEHIEVVGVRLLVEGGRAALSERGVEVALRASMQRPLSVLRRYISSTCRP